MKLAAVCPLFCATSLALAPVHILAGDSVATAKPNPNLELARQLNQAFIDVAEEVSPAVVVITVTQKASPVDRADSSQEQGDSEDPMERFRRFFHRQFEEAPPEKTHGQGSGIIIRSDGYILTNRHVVEDAEKIEVRLKDGRTFKADVRGVDAPSDVAVVKIDAKDLPVAKLADSSKTRVGEFAIAIGAPFALDYSVTFGHVSAKDRSNIIPNDGETPAMTDQSFIQTDANINPGNSGGPLVNINGEVIGINTLIRGLHTGIGFAIPSNLAREVADKLISDGKFTRAWLGITIKSLREDSKYRDLIPAARDGGIQDGVVVGSIVPSGPAAKSDLRPADVITAVDGKTVATAQELKDEIRGKRAGQDVRLDVFRLDKDYKGRQIKVMVKPGEWQDNSLAENNNNSSADNSNTGGIGVTVKALTRELADQFNVDFTEGVIVTAVEKNSLAARSGIKPGDIITSINHQPVANPRQFREATRNLNTQKGVIVNLIADGTPEFKIIKEGED